MQTVYPEIPKSRKLPSYIILSRDYFLSSTLFPSRNHQSGAVRGSVHLLCNYCSVRVRFSVIEIHLAFNVLYSLLRRKVWSCVRKTEMVQRECGYF